MIYFSTRKFKISHGKEPKGFGMWAFETEAGQTLFHTGTFSQAKKSIRERVKHLSGNGLINVLP